MEFLPPRVRGTLLDDQNFVNRWGLLTIATVKLGRDGPSFQRNCLYEAIREAIGSTGRDITIDDSSGTTWQVKVQRNNEGPRFELESGDKKLEIPDHSGLAEEPGIRTEWFRRVSDEVKLDDFAYQQWKEIIESRPLSDGEFSELTTEIGLTPVGNFRNIRNGFLLGSLDAPTLVPSERRYYDRLVGPFLSAVTADVHIQRVAAPLVDSLLEWDRKKGLLNSLLMCATGRVSEFIRVDGLKDEQLSIIYDRIASEGDPISQIAAIEVALQNIEEHRVLEPYVQRMVEGIIAEDPTDIRGSFYLLSAMIVFVDSELSRRRILDGTSPFYRKQAAIAQASGIIRAIKNSQADSASIVNWAKASGFGHVFFLQGLVDLRQEPRWLPDFVSPYQLRAEFIGRVKNAEKKCTARIQSESLRSLLIDEDSLLAEAVEWPLWMLPGPMEGELNPNRPSVPDEFLHDVTVGLEAEHLEPSSFAGIVNLALLYGIPTSQADLAAEALKRVKYSVESMDDGSTLFGLIGCLAHVAAVTRATNLAEALRVLVRVMRRRKRLNTFAEDELRIAMIAAASHEGLEEWAHFAGDWITEIAFEVVDKEAARSFLPKLRRLVQIEPGLARHCAVAEASLASFAR